jgi:ubiquitin-protein ligase
VSSDEQTPQQRSDDEHEAQGDDSAPNLYPEDLVRDNARRSVGVIVRTGWRSDDEYEQDDDDDAEPLAPFEAEVVWLEGHADIVDVHDITAIDRLLLLGDVVERVAAPRGQGPFATVVDVRVAADVDALEKNRAGTAPLFRRRGVDVRAELRRVNDVEPGCLVVAGCFVGVVRHVVFDLDVQAHGRTVTLRDATLDALDLALTASQLPVADLHELEVGRRYSLPVDNALDLMADEQAEQVRAVLGNVSTVTVQLQALRPHSAFVHWMGAPAGRFDAAQPVPTEVMPFAQLVPLLPFNDVASMVASNTAKIAATGRLCKVTLTKTTVDLRWQDGTIERDVRSIDFIPVAHLLEQDHFPGDFVVPEDADERHKNASALSQSPPPTSGAADGDAPGSSIGAAASANLAALDHALDLLLGAPPSTTLATAAQADPLLARNELQRRLGCVVAVQHAAQTCSVLWLSEPSAGGGGVLEHGLPTFSVKPQRDFMDLRIQDYVALLPEHPLLARSPPPPFIGVVKDIDLTTGKMLVRWSDGSESPMDVQQLQRIDPEPILDMLNHGDDDDIDEMSDDAYADDDEELFADDGASGDSGDDEQVAPPTAPVGLSGDALLGLFDSAGLVGRDAILPVLSQLVRDLSRGPQPASRAAVRLYCAMKRFTPTFLPPGRAVDPFPASYDEFMAQMGHTAFSVLLAGVTGDWDFRWFYSACRAHVNSAARTAPPQQPSPAPAAVSPAPAAAPAVGAQAESGGDAVASELFFASPGAPPALATTLVALDLQSLVDEGGALPAAAHGSSHKYVGEKVEFRNAERAMREWQQLQGGLPANGIGVRVYEERLDLLKLVVLGSAGTPYEDVPFFFDVRFPAEYPSKAMEVHFVAFVADKLHPNLNVDGNVCLSLLGTWSGDESESWQGADSTVLQLAMSLQGLVLGDSEPYFLEAGYERQRGTTEGHRNSKRYTERALVLVARHLLHVVARCVQDVQYARQRRAANSNSNSSSDDDDDSDSDGGGVFGFRTLLRAHFRTRGAAITARFKALVASDSDHSAGFRAALRPLVERLERTMSALQEALAATATP